MRSCQRLAGELLLLPPVCLEARVWLEAVADKALFPGGERPRLTDTIQLCSAELGSSAGAGVREAVARQLFQWYSKLRRAVAH